MSISCPTSIACFAAGYTDASGNGRAVIERWYAGRWTVQRAAVGEDQGLDESSATVSCASISRCVAIVDQRTFDGSDDPGTTTYFADVWNGSHWSRRSTPAAVSISCVEGLCATVGNGPPAVLGRHGWRVASSAQAPQFQGVVSCASARMCVAVGGEAGIRWDGSRWSPAAAPVLGAGSQPSELHGVACGSPTTCLAVGVVYTNSTMNPLAEVWNGSSWRLATPPPLPGGGTLESVSCPRPALCVAVGYTQAGVTNGLGRGALVEIWNGSSWSMQATPSLAAGQVELHSVSCSSPSACVAVGLQSPMFTNSQPLIERWNGADWTIDQQASTVASHPNLAGVACASASACEAVGSTVGSTSANQTFSESWNGTGWATVPTVNAAPGGLENALTAVSCTAPAACIAVGSGGGGWGQNNVFAERWDGSTWSLGGPAPGPKLAPNGIACASMTNCEIVGQSPESGKLSARPQAELWNGLSWTAQSTPGPSNGSLESVACLTADSCFAVGATSTAVTGTFPFSAPLIERFG